MTYAIPRPDVQALSQILPDEAVLMMGAGPVPIPQAVAHANSLVINHLGSTMAHVIDQVKKMSRYVFQTESPYILGVAGPGRPPWRWQWPTWWRLVTVCCAW